MTESVLELIPTGGTSGWDRMGLGYDTGQPITWTSQSGSTGTSAIFSLQDTVVAGVISKIVIAYCCSGSETPGRQAYVTSRMSINGTYYDDAVNMIATTSHLWYYVDIEVNPATSAAWTWAEIDALMAGMKVDVNYAGVLYLYQFKVQVYYTPEAYVPPMLVKGSPAVGCGSMIF